MALLALAGFVFGLATTAAFFTLRRRPPTAVSPRENGPAPDGSLTVIDTLFESTPNGIGLWDRDLRFRRVNPALAAINGLPAEAHLGRRLREVAPGLADALEPLFYEVLKTGRPLVNKELVGESPGRPGERRFWRASYYPVTGGDGGIDGVSAIVVEMTESKRTEAALRESEERYRAFIEQTAEAVWRVELEEPVPVNLSVQEQVRRFMATGYLAECNDAMARMYGFDSAGEILGARLPDLLDPSDPKNLDYLGAFVQSGYRLIEAESHERAKDGSDRYFLNNLIGIIENGALCRGWGTQRDITERKWADQALRESREQLRVALKAAHMATWRWDLETDLRVWDGEIPGLFRDMEPSADGQGRAFLDQVHPDDRARLAEAAHAAMEGAGQFREEYRILSPNGSIHWLTDQGQVFREGGSRRVYMAGTCVDVTHHRQVEEQLRQVQRMEAVGRLAGGMAHETNNQMAVVLGFADFVLGRPDLPERVREDVEQIRKAAERTAGITSQLLAFSRRQPARPRVLDLNETVRAFEPVLRRAMSEGCELQFRLTPGLGPMKADPGQVEQVLLNLALNACDAMPHGGTLTIETAMVSLTQEYVRLKTGVRVQPGHYVLLAMSDTGQGMSRETLSRVFEPFFTTKAVGQGTGLGLSTVYGLVKQADGNIWVYSEPGIGTTFKVYFPVISVAQPAVPEPEPTLHLGSGETVLVVEDEPDVRRMAVRSLSEAGYTVLEATGGKEALQIIIEAGDRLRVVVTDVAMPELNGRELGDRIADLRPRLPVIYMSGYTDEDVIRRGLMEPGRRFIQKPFSPDALARQVHEALTLHQSSRP
jgi:two-component system cell cycle sensor histidine kinase/response regulator CckA